jgi:hypothetical protein
MVSQLDGWDLCPNHLPEAGRDLPREEIDMTLSTDSAVPGGVERSPGWGTFNVLLGGAVLILIYDRIPLPYGLKELTPWLQHALIPIGAMLLASLVRRAARHAWRFGIRVKHRLQDMIDVEFTIRKTAKTKSGDH